MPKNMFETNTLSFLLVAFLLIIAPGPDILYLVTQSLAQGKKAAVALALGLSSGNLLHTLAAVLGVSALIRASDNAFNTLKIMGVIYLLYLAWGIVQKLRSASEQDNAIQVQAEAAAALFKRGILMNLLNPKVMLFFLALLPQFVDPQGGAIEWQMLWLGLLFTVEVAITFTTIGVLAGYLGTPLQHHMRSHWMNWIVLTIYLLLAFKLIFVTA